MTCADSPASRRPAPPPSASRPGRVGPPRGTRPSWRGSFHLSARYAVHVELRPTRWGVHLRVFYPPWAGHPALELEAEAPTWAAAVALAEGHGVGVGWGRRRPPAERRLHRATASPGATCQRGDFPAVPEAAWQAASASPPGGEDDVTESLRWLSAEAAQETIAALRDLARAGHREPARARRAPGMLTRTGPSSSTNKGATRTSRTPSAVASTQRAT